jgi:hypothetical protein
MHKIRNFHEGHNTVGEWQGSGRVVAGERHGMCESAFTALAVSLGVTRVFCVSLARMIEGTCSRGGN